MISTQFEHDLKGAIRQLGAQVIAGCFWRRFQFNEPASTSQLVQAMAGFGDGSGAAGGLNAAPLAADTSQQSFLTTPLHG
jgi:hypothetical protein